MVDICRNRNKFPGFVLTASPDTSTHEVEIGMVEDGGTVFVVTLKKNRLIPRGDFVVMEVCDTKQTSLWKSSKETFRGIALPARTNDGSIVIALTSSGRAGKVEQVIPFQKFLQQKPLGMNYLFTLKQEAATFLGREYSITTAERRVASVYDARRKQAAAEERQKIADARNEARIKRMLQVIGRGKIVAYTAEGLLRSGFPVLKDEWMSLSKGVQVIIVESIGADGAVGEPVEYFRVQKERGRTPYKGFLAPVTKQRPKHTTTEKVMPLYHTGETIIEKSDEAFEVLLFPSMDNIREARAAGLSNGTLVAVDKYDPAGRLEVFEVHVKEVATWGLFKPLGV